MTYASQQDLSDTIGAKKLIELADRDLDGVADTGVVEQILTDVGAIIDGYLAQRFDLPLAEVPPLVRVIAIDLAAERLFSTRALDEIASRAAVARDLLREIAAGTVALDVGGVEP